MTRRTQRIDQRLQLSGRLIEVCRQPFGDALDRVSHALLEFHALECRSENRFAEPAPIEAVDDRFEASGQLLVEFGGVNVFEGCSQD